MYSLVYRYGETCKAPETGPTNDHATTDLGLDDHP